MRACERWEPMRTEPRTASPYWYIGFMHGYLALRMMSVAAPVRMEWFRVGWGARAPEGLRALEWLGDLWASLCCASEQTTTNDVCPAAAGIQARKHRTFSPRDRKFSSQPWPVDRACFSYIIL